MVQPSHPGNVGSAARAIKTMGFSELVLVAPRFADMTRQPEAIALASGADDVLAATQTCDTLEQALAPITLACALTARPRDIGPPAADIRSTATIARAHLDAHPDARVAIVLGTERAGLTNEQIGLCHRICHIPANPKYSSLNVAQALQLAAWEMRYALMTGQTATPVPDAQGGDGERTLVPGGNTAHASAPGERNAATADRGAAPASGEAVHALLTHWEQALVAVEFLDPAHPKKLMPRMRHMFNRNALTQDEVDMMRGVCTAMIRIAGSRRTP